MKTLTHIIIAFVTLSLLAADFAPAQNVSGEKVRDDFDIKVRDAEVAAVLAQVQANKPTVPGPIPSPATPPPIPSPVLSTKPASVSNVDDNVYNLTRQLDDLTRNFSSRTRSGSTGTVLVIPSEQTRTEDLLTINEDMSVMSRIFEKNIEQSQLTTARSKIFVSRQDAFATLLGGGRGGIQSIYLQGFGALFLMKVDFPLAAPPDMQEDEKETQKTEEGDPVWRQMRQEMYEPENVERRPRSDHPEEKYDAEKVENLKTTLIKALKHAANIRSMKPDESVVLTITGSSEATGTTMTSVRLTGENQILVQEKGADGKTITRLIQGTSLDDIGLSSPTILVIRAKKSDIDEFAKGDLDFEKFRQRVQVLTCPHLGGAAERGGPFEFYYNNRRSRSAGSRNMR